MKGNLLIIINKYKIDNMNYRIAKETRKMAWDQLKAGYWNVFLNIVVLNIILNIISIFSLGIVGLILTGPISIGLVITSIYVIREIGRASCRERV